MGSGDGKSGVHRCNGVFKVQSGEFKIHVETRDSHFKSLREDVWINCVLTSAEKRCWPAVQSTNRSC